MKNIVKAKHEGNLEALFESSLGRIWQHVQGAENKSFAIFTSWRQNYSRKQNIANFAKFKQAVRGLGHGFIQVQGHWKECQDPDIAYVDCPEDELVDAVEPSLFIVGISQKDAQRLGADSEQDAIVYAGPETNGRVVLLFDDGASQDIGDFKANTIGQAFSELRKSKEGSVTQSFKFEGLEYKATGYLENLIEQEVNKVLNDA